MLEEPSEIVTLAHADEIQRTNPRARFPAFHHDYYYIDMHFGLASIKHRTNSFKVVVNIFSLIIFLFVYTILQILFIRAHRSQLRILTVSFLPHQSPSFFLSQHSAITTALCERFSQANASPNKSSCITMWVAITVLCSFENFIPFFLSIDPLGDAQFSCCFSEMKASLYQDDRSELELQNQDIHDHCVRTESRHDELSSVQVRMSGLQFTALMYVEFLGRERRRVKRCYLVSFSALVVLEQLHNNNGMQVGSVRELTGRYNSVLQVL